MEHLIAQFSSTGMIVLLVTSLVGVGAAVSLVITDYLEDNRRVKTAQKARQALREGRLTMLSEGNQLWQQQRN